MPTWTAVSTNSSHTWPGVRTSRKPSTTAARSRSVTIRMRLRLKRSPSTPARGLDTKAPSMRMANRAPSAAPAPVNCASSDADAMVLNQSPNRLAICANHSRRNARLVRSNSP